jgi:hypothetical protein
MLSALNWQRQATKNIGKRIFFRICGYKPGVVWNMDAGRQRNSERHRFGLLEFFPFFFFLKVHEKKVL